jgi:hypothetical protein
LRGGLGEPGSLTLPSPCPSNPRQVNKNVIGRAVPAGYFWRSRFSRLPRTQSKRRDALRFPALRPYLASFGNYLIFGENAKYDLDINLQLLDKYRIIADRSSTELRFYDFSIRLCYIFVGISLLKIIK